MDPLLDLRADDDDLRAVDPLTRARVRMEAGEAMEARREQARVQERAEVTRSRVLAAEQQDRMELWQQGFLSREVASVAAEAEARRSARIAELRMELDRLTGGRGAGGWRPPAAADVEAEQLLQAHRAGLAEWDSAPIRRQRLLSLESQAARERAAGPGRPVLSRAGTFPAEITRTAPPLACPGAPYPSEDTPLGGPLVPVVDL